MELTEATQQGSDTSVVTGNGTRRVSPTYFAASTICNVSMMRYKRHVSSGSIAQACRRSSAKRALLIICVTGIGECHEIVLRMDAIFVIVDTCMTHSPDEESQI